MCFYKGVYSNKRTFQRFDLDIPGIIDTVINTRNAAKTTATNKLLMSRHGYFPEKKNSNKQTADI